MDVHFIIYFSLLYLTFRKQTAPSRSYFDTAVSALFPVGHLLRFCVVCDAIVASFFFFNLYCFLYYHPVRSYDGCRIHSDSNRITHVKPVSYRRLLRTQTQQTTNAVIPLPLR